MVDDKMMCMGQRGKKYMLFGVLAIVYGVINYLTAVMGWAPYMAWVVGGVILLLIGWAKDSMKG